MQTTANQNLANKPGVVVQPEADGPLWVWEKPCLKKTKKACKLTTIISSQIRLIPTFHVTKSSESRICEINYYFNFLSFFTPRISPGKLAFFKHGPPQFISNSLVCPLDEVEINIAIWILLFFLPTRSVFCYFIVALSTLEYSTNYGHPTNSKILSQGKALPVPAWLSCSPWCS